MFATFQASTKLCHCGSVGKESPAGMVPCGCSAAESMLRAAGRRENSAAAASRMVFGAVSRNLASMSLFLPEQSLDRQDDRQNQQR